jgi:hypothetical protein
MSKNIGIIGAGTAGLHLGLHLRKHGIDATVITDRRPEEYETSRLVNTVAHHAVTLERERRLGVAHWDKDEHHYFCHHHYFGVGAAPLSFRGDFARPSRAVDYRIYLPTLMRDFESRGGKLEYATIAEDDVPALAKRFDLVVAAVGKGALGKLFATAPGLQPFAAPQRHLCVGLYRGIRDATPRGVTLSVAPGQCDLIEIPTLTFGGMATALLCETVPGSDMEEIYRLKYDDDPKRFIAKVLEKLERYHPTVYDRVDTARFELCSPRDLLQGAILPAVRRTSVDLDGTLAVAVGDVHMTLDPIVGQGANMASYGAEVLAEEIVAHDVFDRRFVESVDRRREDRIHSAFHWTNAHLVPPTPELFEAVGAMSANKALCDEFTTDFNYPERQWNHLATPQRIRAWLKSKGAS